jgi:hypothetical protein
VIKLDMGHVSASFSYDITISNLTPFNPGGGGFETGFVYPWFKPGSVSDAGFSRF